MTQAFLPFPLSFFNAMWTWQLVLQQSSWTMRRTLTGKPCSTNIYGTDNINIMEQGFPDSSAGKKKSACNAGDLDSIPRLGRSPGEGKGYPLQYCGLENSMNSIVHRGAKELDMTERLSLSLMEQKHRVSQSLDENTEQPRQRIVYLRFLLYERKTSLKC